MRSMWLSADIALRDMSGSFGLMRRPASERERSPTRARTQESGNGFDTARLARCGHSGSPVVGAHRATGGPNLEEPFGLILSEIRNVVAFRLLSQHFAARTTATGNVPTAGERHESRQTSHRRFAAHRRR